MRFYFFLGLGLAAAGPLAAQPSSQSLAECAGHYQAARAVISRPDLQKKLGTAVLKFSMAATVQAWVEGLNDPHDWLVRHRDGTIADWEADAGFAVVSEEFAEKTAVCRSYGDDHGIDVSLD